MSPAGERKETMVFICYPKCSTCKKAQAWLKAQGLDCEVRDLSLIHI